MNDPPGPIVIIVFGIVLVVACVYHLLTGRFGHASPTLSIVTATIGIFFVAAGALRLAGRGTTNIEILLGAIVFVVVAGELLLYYQRER